MTQTASHLVGRFGGSPCACQPPAGAAAVLSRAKERADACACRKPPLSRVKELAEACACRKPPAGAAAVLSRAKERADACTCRKPLGLGWHGSVREALDELARTKGSLAQARSLAEADVVALIAERTGYASLVGADLLKEGEVEVLFYATAATAVRDNDPLGWVTIAPIRGGRSSWGVALDTPARLRHQLVTYAPSWVTVRSGTSRTAPILRGSRTDAPPRRWNTQVENAMLQRLREQHDAAAE